MPFIRRKWFLPAVILTGVLYLLFRHVQNAIPDIHSKPANKPHNMHWTKQPEHYPVNSYISLPTNPPAKIPKIQFDFVEEGATAKKVREERRNAVRKSFEKSWDAYKKYAWLKDELAPISGGWRNSFGGWAATLVDSMDTLWIMGMKEEFTKAVQALDRIDFSTTDEGTLNLFETTIRYLGGFLAAYDLSGGQYPVLRQKAIELGDMLYSAFDTPNRMPMTRWDWMRSAQGYEIAAGETTLIAELGSLTVEFIRLAQISNDPKYYDAVQRISDELEKAQNSTKMPGLWPVILNARAMTFDFNQFTLGGMADSTYEYLPKAYLMLGGTHSQYRRMYEDAIEVIKKNLLFRPLTKGGEDVLIAGSSTLGVRGEPILDPQGQHLTCFTGGMVGLAAKIFDRPEEIEIARKLVDGCVWAYDAMLSGLMPEIFYTIPCQEGVGPAKNCAWDEQRWLTGITSKIHADGETAKMPPYERAQHFIETNGLVPGFTDITDPRYILRPEAIESVFILYRITGDTALQDVAWRMFQSIEKATRTEIANAAVDDVRQSSPKKSDRMESFWLAETLKYFYLIFSEPDLVSLDEYVL